MKKITLTLMSLCFFLSFNAQNLADAKRLFEKKSYVQAAELFLEIEPKNQELLEKLGDCYFFTSNLEEASKWYTELMNAYKDETNFIYYYRYSQVLYGTGDAKEANKWLELYNNSKLTKRTDVSTVSEEYEYLKNKDSDYILTNLSSNTNLSEFGGAFLNEKFVFASTKNESSKYNWNQEPYLNLVSADLDKSGELENIIAFSDHINTKRHESNAVFTKDGKTMYFTASNRGGLAKSKINHLKIYKAELVDNQWKNLTDLSINSIDYSTEHPALSEDEKKLYFASDRPGSIGSFDIYVVDILESGKLGEPINLGNKINTDHREQFPYILKDTLFFASTGHIGLGGLDIFKSVVKANTDFSTPKNLGKGINSSLDDFGFVLSKDNSFGYFSSNREGGKGGDDIYRFKRIIKQIKLKGVIKDKNTLDPLEGVVIELVKNGDTTSNVLSNPDGSFIFDLDTIEKHNYAIKVTKTLYKPQNVSLDNFDPTKPLEILLEKYVGNTSGAIVYKNNKTQIFHEPILFDLNSSYLTPKATVILDNIVSILRQYPEIIIRCESHTDSRATAKYNKWLSDRRAKRTAEYIISKGISSSRITEQGFGETQLLNECSDDVTCSDEEHHLNRRTEFVLIDKK
ncbi:MAG: OmpA family protein [Winogradskyella sp.]